MASNRAAEIAEVLWELKRAGKLATLSAIAARAGFSPGAEGKAVRKCLDTIRNDWSHLEWWRVIEDDGTVPSKGPHIEPLRALGIDFADERKGFVSLLVAEELMMVWDADEGAEEPVAAAGPAE